MAEPISWVAVEAVRDLVRQVTVANGFHTDLGLGRIVLDDEQVGDDGIDDGQPATIIDGTDITLGGTGRGFAHSEMDLVVEFVIPRGSDIDNPKQLAHRGAADLIRALSFKDNDRRLPKCFRNLVVSGARLRGWTDQAAEASYVIAQVTARAGLTDLASPAS